MKPDPLKICLLEPFFGGSHRRWAEGLKAVSRHDIDILSLPARHWKWRMHGAAVTLASLFKQSKTTYDLVLATDMMDVAVFSALAGGGARKFPVYTYFHENQISYPVSPRDTDLSQARDLHYGFINYTSALASDRIFFNSDYHRHSFLKSLPGFLAQYPDFQNPDSVDVITAKSSTLALGMDLRALDRVKPAVGQAVNRKPLILWNHRWEYDKCPEQFFALLFGLMEKDIEFEVVLLGERGSAESVVLSEARRRLGNRIIHDGPVEDPDTYAMWLWRSDILPITSIQDFFGGSVVEAIYCGCHPILPARLAYPEHVADSAVFYQSDTEALEKLVRLISSGEWRRPFAGAAGIERYDWSNCCNTYDRVLHPA